MLSRRIFLITGSAAGAGLMLGIAGCARKTAPPPHELTMWIAIAPDGITTIRVNASDIGQGAQTGLAQIVADELDADWTKVRVEMAPVTDAYMVKDGNGYYTGGSSSIHGQYDMFAKAGATARHLLARWEREGLVTSDGARERDSTGRLAPRRWTLVARQIGPRAPVLHGPILTGSGYAVMAA